MSYIIYIICNTFHIDIIEEKGDNCFNVYIR